MFSFEIHCNPGLSKLKLSTVLVNKFVPFATSMHKKNKTPQAHKKYSKTFGVEVDRCDYRVRGCTFSDRYSLLFALGVLH